MLFKLHVRYTVHEKSSDTVGALVNRYTVTALVESICCGKSRGTRTDNSYPFSAADLWYLRLHNSVFKAVFNDGALILPDSHGRAVKSAGAGFFAERRADP